MATADNTRYARCLLVVKEVFPEILRRLVTSEQNHMPPQILYGMIDRNKEFKEKLNTVETEMVQSLITNGYDLIEFKLLYKLCNFYKLIDEPSQGWGNFPQPEEAKPGDETERLRKYRNNLMRRTCAEVPDGEERLFFTNVLEVARRIDTHLGQNDQYFENEVRSIQRREIDEQTVINCTKYLEVQVQCSERVGRHHVWIYYGDDITSWFGNKSSGDSSYEKLTLYISCSDDIKEELVRKVNLLKDDINQMGCDIVLRTVETGSFLLQIKVKSIIFASKRKYDIAILNFLIRLLSYHDVDVLLQEKIDVILSVSDCNFPEIDDLSDVTDTMNFDPQPSRGIKLNVRIDHEAFRDPQTFHTNIANFVGAIVERVEGASNVSFTSPINVVVRSPETPRIMNLDRNIS